jgi:hypothetical protein
MAPFLLIRMDEKERMDKGEGGKIQGMKRSEGLIV